ncbi:phage tail assembly protein [Lentzea sp. NPDC051208]|uniref:phage tail assembly protein n=1 Tax=Lentzea sp. NPDC051208 TaxID=3154642 RepID=UPI003423A1C2
MDSAPLRTEYPFVLPRGYVDHSGQVHRSGVMRLATARDEIAPQTDPQVRQNPAYLTVLLLSRTVTRLGRLDRIDAEVIEGLFASDLAFLQDLYRRINQQGHTEADVRCPGCGQEFSVDVSGDASGES